MPKGRRVPLYSINTLPQAPLTQRADADSIEEVLAAKSTRLAASHLYPIEQGLAAPVAMQPMHHLGRSR